MESALRSQSPRQGRPKEIKCVVWDLDNTLWEGVLLEGDRVALRAGVKDIVRALDGRGILNSIASKNERGMAMAKLQELGLDEYFLYPQISWNSKASSIKAIAESINIGLDTVAFIDDEPFEREEVRFSLPEVLCIDAAALDQLLAMPEMNPRFVTQESKSRRWMYLSDMERTKAEEAFIGPKEEFLATLTMILTISPATEEDLQRAEELTLRTNQLNATGYVYSYDELNTFRQSDHHELLVASLEDRFGSYGTVGLALIECAEDVWAIKLLLMSCRVMTRGVGTILLNHIMRLAKDANVRLHAEFVPTDRNRLMYVTYKFAGFREIEEADGVIILANDLTQIQPVPEYVKLQVASKEP